MDWLKTPVQFTTTNTLHPLNNHAFPNVPAEFLPSGHFLVWLLAGTAPGFCSRRHSVDPRQQHVLENPARIQRGYAAGLPAQGNTVSARDTMTMGVSSAIYVVPPAPLGWRCLRHGTSTCFPREQQKRPSEPGTFRLNSDESIHHSRRPGGILYAPYYWYVYCSACPEDA